MLKQTLFAKLESEFDISMTNGAMRLAVDYSLSKRFINFKYHCHKHYLALGADARQTPPENVKMEEWIKLCEHFESDRFKRQSAANKRNKSMQTFAHTTGGKSCNQRMYEMETTDEASNEADAKNNDNESDEAEVEPKEIRVYADTHKRKNGTWVNEEPQKTM
ncbi:unnamed protein product [Linum trigynum]|uniref:Uncharacterized protein n=1 Tax=Linum trigynum TaxID=586398 RepID=A0AAV2CFC0_9ROSI